MDNGGGYHISQRLVIWPLCGVFWILTDINDGIFCGNS